MAGGHAQTIPASAGGAQASPVAEQLPGDGWVAQVLAR